jgi:hypothetical protein
MPQMIVHGVIFHDAPWKPPGMKILISDLKIEPFSKKKKFKS